MIVDNIGLSGVLMPKGENERQIFLTADSWVPETTRLCFAVEQQAGGAMLAAGDDPRAQAEPAGRNADGVQPAAGATSVRQPASSLDSHRRRAAYWLAARFHLAALAEMLT